jgi:hypothetical protein
MAWRGDHGLSSPAPIRHVPTGIAEHLAAVSAPPDRASYLGDPAENDLDERRQAFEALLDLAERFGVRVPAATSRQDDPAALMVLLADRLRYRGPTLAPSEVASLGAAPDHDGALALRWHARIGHFVPDRPLPRAFAQGPLRWQLDTLAWSFHLEVSSDPVASRRSTAEVAHALAAALANDLPLPPPTLVTRYPALAAYHDFLRCLPRR